MPPRKMWSLRLMQPNNALQQSLAYKSPYLGSNNELDATLYLSVCAEYSTKVRFLPLPISERIESAGESKAGLANF